MATSGLPAEAQRCVDIVEDFLSSIEGNLLESLSTFYGTIDRFDQEAHEIQNRLAQARIGIQSVRLLANESASGRHACETAAVALGNRLRTLTSTYRSTVASCRPLIIKSNETSLAAQVVAEEYGQDGYNPQYDPNYNGQYTEDGQYIQGQYDNPYGNDAYGQAQYDDGSYGPYGNQYDQQHQQQQYPDQGNQQADGDYAQDEYVGPYGQRAYQGEAETYPDDPNFSGNHAEDAYQHADQSNMDPHADPNAMQYDSREPNLQSGYNDEADDPEGGYFDNENQSSTTTDAAKSSQLPPPRSGSVPPPPPPATAAGSTYPAPPPPSASTFGATASGIASSPESSELRSRRNQRPPPSQGLGGPAHGHADDKRKIVQAKSEVTDSLQDTLGMMTEALDQSASSQELLSQSTNTMSSTAGQYSKFGSLLRSSKTLIKSLERREVWDRFIVMAVFGIFLLTCFIIFKRRVLDKGINVVNVITENTLGVSVKTPSFVSLISSVASTLLHQCALAISSLSHVVKNLVKPKHSITIPTYTHEGFDDIKPIESYDDQVLDDDLASTSSPSSESLTSSVSEPKITSDATIEFTSLSESLSSPTPIPVVPKSPVQIPPDYLQDSAEEPQSWSVEADLSKDITDSTSMENYTDSVPPTDVIYNYHDLEERGLNMSSSTLLPNTSETPDLMDNTPNTTDAQESPDPLNHSDPDLHSDLYEQTSFNEATFSQESLDVPSSSASTSTPTDNVSETLPDESVQTTFPTDASQAVLIDMESASQPTAEEDAPVDTPPADSIDTASPAHETQDSQVDDLEHFTDQVLSEITTEQNDTTITNTSKDYDELSDESITVNNTEPLENTTVNNTEPLENTTVENTEPLENATMNNIELVDNTTVDESFVNPNATDELCLSHESNCTDNSEYDLHSTEIIDDITYSPENLSSIENIDAMEELDSDSLNDHDPIDFNSMIADAIDAFEEHFDPHSTPETNSTEPFNVGSYPLSDEFGFATTDDVHATQTSSLPLESTTSSSLSLPVTITESEPTSFSTSSADSAAPSSTSSTPSDNDASSTSSEEHSDSFLEHVLDMFISDSDKKAAPQQDDPEQNDAEREL